jgi:hypothetical protein
MFKQIKSPGSAAEPMDSPFAWLVLPRLANFSTARIVRELYAD